jgi:alpha-N-arabinofuranosidase
VQKVFSTNLGDVVVPMTGENIPSRTFQPPAPKSKPGQPPAALPPPKQVATLFFVATKSSATGTVYLKIVNTSDTARQVRINLNGAAKIGPEGTAITLSSAHPEDTNTIGDPKKIVPITRKIDGLATSFVRPIAPYSVNVLRIETR